MLERGFLHGHIVWCKLTNFLSKVLIFTIKIIWKLIFHTLFASKRLHHNDYI